MAFVLLLLGFFAARTSYHGSVHAVNLQRAPKYSGSHHRLHRMRPHRAPVHRTPLIHLPFYQITHPGSHDTSYIFGTLHLLESSYVDTLPQVMYALRRADIVVGELAIDSSLTGDALAGLFDSPPLDSLVTPAEYDEIESAVKTYSPVPLAVITHAEPIIVYTMILEGMYSKAHPENHSTGIAMDLYFQNEAQKLGIPVMGLEEASDQESALEFHPDQGANGGIARPGRPSRIHDKANERNAGRLPSRADFRNIG